jgi:alkylation response protein AidB-like acyl-CoA dehydrogenase
MLNITRLWNSVAAIGSMRRVIALARDFAGNRTPLKISFNLVQLALTSIHFFINVVIAARRVAFGHKLTSQPLHIDVLARMDVHTRACTLLVLELALLTGKVECNVRS